MREGPIPADDPSWTDPLPENPKQVRVVCKTGPDVFGGLIVRKADFVELLVDGNRRIITHVLAVIDI